MWRSGLVAVCLTLAAVMAQAADGLSVRDGWIREAPPNAKALGAFMEIRNGSDQPRTLVGVSTDVAEKVELHRTVMEGGMAKMIAQPNIPVPANGQVILAPGGLHVMLIGPRRVLKAGEKVELTLEFDDGSRLPVVVDVRHGGSAMPMSHHHGHGMMH